MTIRHFNGLAYEEIGEENSKTILFLHSKLLDKWIWIKQKEDYSKHFKDFHCIFLDLPHHGDSRCEGDFSIMESSKEIREFIEWIIDVKNIEKINVVSLGIGGQIAIEIFNENPLLIDNLVLSGMEIADFKEEESSSVVNRLAKTQSEYLNEKPDMFIVKAYLRYYGIPREYYEYMESILEISIKDERDIAYESLNYTISDDMRKNEDILKKENILIAYGTKEDLNCAKSAIELKNLFKNGKLIEINRGNHLWNIIDYELFNAVIAHFIKFDTIKKDSKIKILE